jgi:hypothetical protein
VIGGAVLLFIVAAVVGLVFYVADQLSPAIRNAITLLVVLGLLVGGGAIAYTLFTPPSGDGELAVRGTVQFDDRRPVSGADVSVVGDARVTKTLTNGAFELSVRRSAVSRDSVTIAVLVDGLSYSFPVRLPGPYALTVIRQAKPQVTPPSQPQRPSGAMRPTFLIDSVALFGALEGASVRIVAIVNGNRFTYPSQPNAKWVRVSHDMPGESYSLPPTPAEYAVRFDVQARTDSNRVFSLSSPDESRLKPSARFARLDLYAVQDSTREQRVGYIKYRILPRPPQR